MPKSILRIACGLLIMLVVVGGLAACGDDDTPSEPDYADQITEDALQSMSDCDYATHVALYTPEAQSAITEDIFETTCPQLKDLIGDYIDKEFRSTQTQNSYIVVEYIANYSQEPDGVTVNVYFEEIEGEIYIAGIWMDSPKLREFSGE